MLDNICQYWILIFGLLAIFLTTQNKKKLRQFGVVIGLISQPAFIITSYINDQTGLFILSVAYLFIWINGVLVQCFNFDVLSMIVSRFKKINEPGGFSPEKIDKEFIKKIKKY